MAFLKKSLFLVLFLGLVSLSVCEEEKRENEDEEEQEDDEQSEEKRALWKTIIKGAGKMIGSLAKNLLGSQAQPESEQ
uniref:Dermaseptin-B9 n=1 Tax=Phyllomedusa bicolor TaxID=8393 RepID=DRS9_PHYBI|nr:RecName: Full=Dermaseptin-B9; Short=DRS-B9; AltName: Full=Dermaseptin-gene related 3; Short=Dermaseptin DRG3; Flags: Precursor [Phyllomedusa bicolor]CAC37581.1 dermaseptin 3 [Phyllomedusa bicolor]